MSWGTWLGRAVDQACLDKDKIELSRLQTEGPETLFSKPYVPWQFYHASQSGPTVLKSTFKASVSDLCMLLWDVLLRLLDLPVPAKGRA
eukprot:1862836-Amphidinium_carterae.1